MREITIGKNDAGQRMDRFLGKYMRLAPKSFFYKMMRKKNITLNGKRCEGSELLAEGDTVTLFLSDETIGKFSGETHLPETGKAPRGVRTPAVSVIYEDDDIILIDKPSGMLSQKAKESDVSLVEHLIAYLLSTGAVTEEELRSFRPSVCNRLDRNTSGIVAAGKSLEGLRFLSEILRDRSAHKYYRCIVLGELKEPQTLDGWLVKDEEKNTVRVYTDGGEKRSRAGSTAQVPGKAESPRDPGIPDGAARIVTRYEPIASNGACTLLDVELVTGRSHQIRAHLASIGHPVAGDIKYGADARGNSRSEISRGGHGGDSRGRTLGGRPRTDPIAKKYGLRSQLLHAYRFEFPHTGGKFAYLSGRVFEAGLPEEFKRVAEGEGLIKRLGGKTARINEKG